MRITILTQYFPPEMGAPPARLFELAARLQDKGHVLTVVTAMPNRPTGRIFDGYRGKLRMFERMDGFDVVRFWLRPNRTANVSDRTICDLSFACTSMLFGSRMLGKQDVLIVQNPPLLSILNGYVMGRLSRAKIVLWAGDLWPDILIESGQIQEGIAARGMFALQKLGYCLSNLVAVTNRGAERQVRERYPHVKTVVWPNGVDTTLFRPELRSDKIREEFGAGPNDFLVGYIGLYGRFQGLQSVLAAAQLLRERSHIKFILIGEGVEKERLTRLAREKGLTNLALYGARPKEQIPPILASCDASLAPLKCRLPSTMPSKVCEALAAGVPVIASRGCQAEALVEANGVGRAFEPMDAEQLASSILDLAGHPETAGRIRRNCRKLAMRFDRDVLAEQVHQTLVALHEGRRPV